MFATQMEGKRIAFTSDASQVHDDWVLCDKNRLNRVLLNLLSNAYKFTPEGGEVSVRLLQVGDAQDGRASYELRVRDTGIGMTPEFAERIFEAFERERTSTVSGIEGTGLGMAITKAIVDLMGGTIQIITAPGEGTEFIVTLSLELADESLRETEEQQDALAAAQADFSGKRILLVEDNAINLEIARLILEEAGFELECATNGKEALDMVSQAEPGHYDAVLTDVQMPVMDGYEEARAIRALPDPQRANVPIFAVTANAFAEDVAAAEAAGMNGHLAKPLDVDKVMHTLAKLFVEQQEK
jgi:CheY-like chemotaxis protein